MQLANSIKKVSRMFVGTKFDWLIISNLGYFPSPGSTSTSASGRSSASSSEKPSQIQDDLQIIGEQIDLGGRF